MKTRLLFIPDESTFVLLESDLSAERLAGCVNAGEWRPPPPYERMGWKSCEGGRLQAICLGKQVVVFTGKTGELKDPRIERKTKPHLTARQQQVLKALAEGLTSKQIALRMGTTLRTVTRYVAEIKACLQASTRAQVVSRAAALGLLEKPGKEEE